MTDHPSPSDLAGEAMRRVKAEHEKRQARYTGDLADAFREVEHVYNSWLTKLNDQPDHTSYFAGEPITNLVAALLTIATLDNMPEDLP